MIETISIEEAAYELEYQDTRSVGSWAKKLGIQVFTQGKRKYMIREEFTLAYDQPVIDYLIEKYGEKHGMELYNNRELHTDLKPPINKYEPTGRAEKEFLKNITSKVQESI